MPVSGAEILTISRMRNELRIPEGDDGHDSFIQEQIESAASFVARDLRIPLIDTECSQVIRQTDKKANISVNDQFIRSISSIRYQSATEIERYGIFPDEIPVEEYTVYAPSIHDWMDGKGILEPAGQWPDSLQAEYKIFYVRGIPADDRNLQAYQSLMVLWVRAAYNGIQMDSNETAYARIAEKLRYYGRQ